MVLNAIRDESIKCFEGLKDNAVGGLDAPCKIVPIPVGFEPTFIHLNGKTLAEKIRNSNKF